MKRQFSVYAESLERRLFLAGSPTPPDLSPLSIPNLVFDNGVFTATNPTISVNGTPTVSLQGTVTVGGGNIQANGQVRAAFGGNQLLFGGNFTIPIGNAATSALGDTLGDVADRLQLAGTKLTFQNLMLSAGGVQFDATAKLPSALGAFELNATGVSFNASGVSAATLGISDPSVYQFDLGGFKLNAQNLSATYEVAQQRMKFTGLFNAPQLNTTVDLTGSKFLAVSAGPTIEFVGGVSVNGPVTIGGPWKLNSLDLQVAYQNDAFTTSGTGVVDTGGGNLNIQAQFASNVFSFSAAGGATFSVLGMTFTLSTFSFTSDQSAGGAWDPKVEIQGSIALPQQFGSFTVAVQGANKLTIDSTGVSLTGGTLSLPGNQTFTVLNLIELKTQNATLSFDFAQSEMKLQGTYTIPTLNNLQINLSGSNFAALKFDNGLDFAMMGSFTNISVPIFGGWELQNGSVTINKPYGTVPGDVTGSFQIKTPNNTTITLALAFLNGRLAEVSATNNGTNPDFTFFGVSGKVSSVKFIPDINPGNQDDFEPQLELQGSVSFPTSFGTVTGGGAVTFSVANPEKFILNESGFNLTGGSISIPSINFNLLNVVKVQAQSLSVQYISTPTASLRVSGIVKIPQLYNLTLNFDPAQGRFIQFDSAGNVTVNGVISVSNVAIVPNLWVIKNASFAFNNSGAQSIFEVNASLQIPSGAIVGGKIKFVSGDLDAISLFGENLRIPLGATGVFLQRIDGGLENLTNPTGNPPLKFSGGMGLSFGPRIDIQLPSIVGGAMLTGSLVDLTVNGTIDRNSLSVNGDVAVVGNSRPPPPSGLITGSAGLELNWSRGTFTGNWNVSILGGLFSANVNVQANSAGTLGFTGVGTGKLPDGIPFFGLQLPSANGALYFTNNNNYADDFVATWGSITIPGVPLISDPYVVTKGIKVFFNGTFQTINTEVVLPPILTNEERAEYAINAGTPEFVVTADWANRTLAPQQVRVQFFDPDLGQLIDVTTPGNGIVTGVRVAQLQNGNRTFVLNGVQRTGRYVFTLVPPAGQAFNNTQWAGGIPNKKPTINITSATVGPNGSDVTFNYTALDPDDQAKITFFIDSNNAGFTGSPVRVVRNNATGFEVPEFDAADSVVWRSADLFGSAHHQFPSGTYYVYARIDDGINAPVFKYFNQPFTVDTNANAHVVRLFVGSTQWTTPFKDGLAARLLGGEDGFLLYEAGVDPRRANVPWANLDRIVVQFNQAVDLPDGAVTLAAGAGVPISVENDLVNARLIITLDNFQVTGNPTQYLLTLAETITSVFDELPLDGNNDRTPGDAALRPYRSLPGDVDASQGVNIDDFATLAQAFFSTPTSFSNAYTPFSDFNGDGVINISDFGFLARNFGQAFSARAVAPIPPGGVAARSPFGRNAVLAGGDLLQDVDEDPSAELRNGRLS